MQMHRKTGHGYGNAYPAYAILYPLHSNSETEDNS